MTRFLTRFFSREAKRSPAHLAKVGHVARHAAPNRLCLCAWALIVGAGCALEFPEVPYFETELTMPLGHQSTTGWDIARDRAYLTGDSTGTTPLSFFYEGEIDTVRLADRFDVGLGEARFMASLEHITLDLPAGADELFTLDELSDLPIPPEGDSLVVPPFPLPSVRHTLAAQSAFNWLRLASGSVRIGIRNSLPVPIGTSDFPGPPFGVRLRDRSSGRLLLTATWTTSLAPAQEGSLRVSLAGVELTRLMDLEVFGEIAGSEGRRVWVSPSSAIGVEVDFEEMLPDSAIAVVGPQSIDITDTLGVDLAGELGIVRGALESGLLPISIENGLPLPATGILFFHELEENGQPIPIDIEIAAATNGVPGRFAHVVTLQGRSVRSLDGLPLTKLTYSLSVTTPASRGVVALGRRQLLSGFVGATTVRFAEVEARPSALSLPIPRTTTSIDVPNELDGLDLTVAELRVEVENALPFPASAELFVTGREPTSSDSVTVPIRLDIASGSMDVPVISQVAIDEQGTRLLDLIALRPSELHVSGQVRVGNDGRTATLTRDAWIRGRYELSAPLRFRVSEIVPEVDPFLFRVDSGVQERIREDLVSARAEGTISNHFPLAAEARIVFAASEDGLANPDIVLDPVLVEAAQIDPATGRVIAGHDTRFELPLREDQLPFFARDRVWGRIEVRLFGDGNTVVIITATDHVEAAGFLRFRFGIGDAEADG